MVWQNILPVRGRERGFEGRGARRMVNELGSVAVSEKSPSYRKVCAVRS